MKWFWYSLVGFCLLMCSCRTKKIDNNVMVRSDIRSDLAILNESVKISTQNHACFANEAQSIIIEEDITVIEYDKETGKPAKETKTKRKTTQDTDKVSTEEETQSVTDCNQLNVDHIEDKLEKVESETKEESIGGQEAFGKWFGIGIACVFGLFLLYLVKKMRVN